MSGDEPSSYNLNVSSSRATTKRDSLVAELERDPQLSAAKRQQRTKAFRENIAHASLERKLLAAQTSKTELETKLQEKNFLVERLERDRRWFADREKEEREEKERERSEHEEEMQKADAELRTLRIALSTLREQYGDLKDTYSGLSRTSTHNLASRESQITSLTHQVSLLSQELEESRHIAEERRHTVHEMQEKIDILEQRDRVDIGKEAEGDMAVVREELHSQAGYLRDLESANARFESELRIFREKHESIEVLMEEKRSLEMRVRTFEEMRERVVALEAEVEAGRKEREDWAKKAAEIATPSNTPVSVTQTLSALRLTYARLLEEHGANVALLRQREADISEAETLLSEFKSTNDVLVKELDALADVSSHRRSWEELVEDAGRERTSRLKYQQALEKANTELSAHSEKIEELEQKLFDLGGEMAAGHHVPPGVRVLSLRDNPEKAWVDLRQSTMDRLRVENEALLNRLKELEAAAASADTGAGVGTPEHEALVPRESWELLDREKKELEELVTQKDKRLKRLKEVYTAKGEEFREAMASILGLKLAFYPNGQVRVTSIYDLCAAFVFQPLPKTEQGSRARMQLLAKGEGGPQELPQLMRYWIEEEQCIPGFLASVTMECYDKAKREGTLVTGMTIS